MSEQDDAMEAHTAQVTRYRASRQASAVTLAAAIEAHAIGVWVNTQVLADMVTMLTSYEDGITWETTCTNCARLMNANYVQYEQIEQLKTELKARKARLLGPIERPELSLPDGDDGPFEVAADGAFTPTKEIW